MKAETKHTPGPWTLEYDGALVMGGQVVGRAPHPDFAPEQRLPNARLIAAAPEMYSLLDLADELDGNADSDHDARLALEKIGNAARALIAKIKQS